MHTQAEQRAHEIEASCEVAYAIWSALFKQNLRAGLCRPFVFGLLFGLFEIALVLVGFDHVAISS